MNILNVIKRHPVLTYFVLAYGIAWAGILLVIRAFATPGQAASTSLVGLVFLPMLFAPGLASITITALVEGRAGLKGLWSRMTRWQADVC